MERSILENSQIAQNYQENKRYQFGISMVLIVVLFILPLILGKYWNYAAGTVGIYILMGLGLNIVVGLAGLLDLVMLHFLQLELIPSDYLPPQNHSVFR